jgi:hypothetical protein
MPKTSSRDRWLASRRAKHPGQSVHSPDRPRRTFTEDSDAEDTITETAGARTVSQMVRELELAGQRLVASRRQRYDLSQVSDELDDRLLTSPLPREHHDLPDLIEQQRAIRAAKMDAAREEFRRAAHSRREEAENTAAADTAATGTSAEDTSGKPAPEGPAT